MEETRRMILGVEGWQHTLVPGFSGVFETAPHVTHPVDAVLWRQRQGFPAPRHRKEGTIGLERMPGALNWCISLYMTCKA